MKSAEEYRITKELLMSPKVDGPYYSALRLAMLKKFSNQPDPEERLRKLEGNALEIFQKIQKLKNGNGGEKNLLLVGKVQSGKTSNMQMALALAFDNGYDCLIMYGGYDNTLLRQTIGRFANEAFKKPDGMSEKQARFEWANIFTTDPQGTPNPLSALTESNYEKIKSSGGKVIVICRKGPDAINKVNDLFQSWDSCDKIRALVFDDEGDQASLNNEFRKNSESPTYKAICRMKNLLGNPPYLSVTATPQALVFSPSTSELKPSLLQLIEPGKGYRGLDEFHLNDKQIMIVEDEMDDYLAQDNQALPPSLWKAVRSFLISSALQKKTRGIEQAEMIVHFDKRIKKHQLVCAGLCQYLKSLQDNIKNHQIDTINTKFDEDFRPIFEDERVFSSSLKNNVSFSDIVEDLKKVILESDAAPMNRPGKEEMSKMEWVRYPIYVGADLLQRGVTFDDLTTTYFTRWPKGPSNMDTQIQRARWLGYRSKIFDFCRVFTTKEIAYRFSILAAIEDDLWDQMREVQNGTRTLESIMVEADPKMRPSRRSAADYHTKTFGRKWLNQSIGTTFSATTKENNLALKSLLGRYSFVATTAGATVLDPGRITAYHSYISFDDFASFVRRTNDIFDNHPFSSETLLKLAFSKRIDLIVFWNPETSNLDCMDFGDDLRERSFSDVENGCRVSALQQGADKVEEENKKYKGDAYVINDPDALTIQVFPISPKRGSCPVSIEGQTQFMYSIHTPQAVSVYVGGSEN